MRLIFTNLRENHAEKGLDWIVMGANALAVAIVLIAASSENPFNHAVEITGPSTFEVASLD